MLFMMFFAVLGQPLLGAAASAPPLPDFGKAKLLPTPPFAEWPDAPSTITTVATRTTPIPSPVTTHTYSACGGLVATPRPCASGFVLYIKNYAQCGHVFHMKSDSDKATHVDEHMQPCEKVQWITIDIDDFCDDDCPYRLRCKRWRCCACKVPNKDRYMCAMPSCTHIICDDCRPLPKPALSNKPLLPPPPVPLYDASVGDWVRLPREA
ncbi:hypothetical protein CkaCkLH20_10457 [Colletotrichum karsti]|uniref:Uncharacterized protein n=1 Tax=Colletotrichum karsti TaxID=1095194 RepID=A0A9P6HXT8_9PEZI|nr:uncharacterized protein CkaCkLH20_10457 [Colletotrichum karsti]KAF9872120.1 hypothetical protein CkaCkLH20_10457 [Colletotrichum karsti]